MPAAAGAGADCGPGAGPHQPRRQSWETAAKHSLEYNQLACRLTSHLAQAKSSGQNQPSHCFPAAGPGVTAHPRSPSSCAARRRLPPAVPTRARMRPASPPRTLSPVSASSSSLPRPGRHGLSRARGVHRDGGLGAGLVLAGTRRPPSPPRGEHRARRKTTAKDGPGGKRPPKTGPAENERGARIPHPSSAGFGEPGPGAGPDARRPASTHSVKAGALASPSRTAARTHARTHARWRLGPGGPPPHRFHTRRASRPAPTTGRGGPALQALAEAASRPSHLRPSHLRPCHLRPES